MSATSRRLAFLLTETPWGERRRSRLDLIDLDSLPRLVRDDPDFKKKYYGLTEISVFNWDKEVDSQYEVKHANKRACPDDPLTSLVPQEISDLAPESSQPEDVTFK